MTLGYRLDGDPAAPRLVVLGSLGTTLSMWEPQLTAWTERFSLVRIDHPGHGASPVPEGPITIHELGAGVLAVLDDLGSERFSFCGLSLGGSVGLWLANQARERVERLVLCCSAARWAPPERWSARAQLVRREGMAAVAATVLERWFTPRFRAAQRSTVERYREMLLSIPAEGYARCCDVVRDLDLREELAAITAPTLVVAATEDPAVSGDALQILLEGLPDAQLMEVRAAHLASVEQPDAVASAVLEHIGAGQVA